jgi:hypothetical protein
MKRTRLRISILKILDFELRLPIGIMCTITQKGGGYVGNAFARTQKTDILVLPKGEWHDTERNIGQQS